MEPIVVMGNKNDKINNEMIKRLLNNNVTSIINDERIDPETEIVKPKAKELIYTFTIRPTFPEIILPQKSENQSWAKKKKGRSGYKFK